jgi:hypothetical protein
MATQPLTDEQVVQLVKQLPTRTKQQVLKALTDERDQWWQTTAREEGAGHASTGRGLPFGLGRPVRIAARSSYG